ncbi:MAG: ribose 5-phosphate isomerase B [Clostridia bacterium]|nr:ribose 5-phosphate isomerase B [Clostridia bacterium]MBR6742136.1 ribose 5-phosphate isomerase B [Clostridia bacterium]
MKNIYIGCDHGGFELKNTIIERLLSLGYEVFDAGTYTNESCNYPVYAKEVCRNVLENEGSLGILVCGTGIGMSIAANKIKGIRAAHCTDTFSAKMTRRHNNANVLCLGARITGSDLALDIVDDFLANEFEGGRHATRVEMLTEIEKEN